MSLVFSILGWIVKVVVGTFCVVCIAHLICEISEGLLNLFSKPK